MNNKERLGRLLRKARTARDRTLVDVSASLELSFVYLSHVERGKRPVTPEKLDQIAQELKLSEADYRRAFFLLGRLPPRVEAHFLAHPESWPEGA